MRGFLYGVALVVILAACMEAANAQAVEYTSEDTMTLGMLLGGLFALCMGYMAGRHR